MRKIALISLLVIIIDRITKIVVMENMKINNYFTIIKNFFNITYVKNTGAAFSILKGSILLLIIIAIIALTLIYFFLIKNKNLTKYDIISYGLLIGGIIGNLIDRVIYNAVIDFLDFKILTYHFPIFNIADIAIVIGIFILILITIREDRNARNNN